MLQPPIQLVPTHEIAASHDAQTANSFVCLERGRRCVLLLANDVRAEARFADLVRFVLGETGVPYDWEYADRAGKS